MDSFNDVMDAVKAYCKGRVSDASYRVFIQDLNLLNFEGTNIIILEVPNDVVMRFAAARYADLLKEAFASILGFEVELKFVLAAPAPDGGKAAEKPKLDENDRATTTRLMKVKDMLLQQSIEEQRQRDAEVLERFREA